jgi:hypothetical protein
MYVTVQGTNYTVTLRHDPGGHMPQLHPYEEVKLTYIDISCSDTTHV